MILYRGMGLVGLLDETINHGLLARLWLRWQWLCDAHERRIVWPDEP